MVGGGKNGTFIVCMSKRGGVGDGKKGLSFCTNYGFVVGFSSPSIRSLLLNHMRG